MADVKGTEYVVLELVSPPAEADRWTVMANLTARTPEKAIEQAIRARVALGPDAPEAPAFCVAVPSRSWTVLPVATSREVTVTVG